jgi:endonuclease/exonuclease/phosphatase family metal-dependent hydrolase
MSYNTQYSGYPSKMWEYAQLIRSVAPAIVGLQECQDRDGLARQAGYTALTGTGHCNYIIYNPREATPMKQGSLEITSENTRRFNYAKRCISYGQFRLGDSAIWFFNTHLPHNDGDAWPKQTHARIARAFLKKRRELGAENSPSIIVGDFNPHASDFNNVHGGGFKSNLQANGFTHAYESFGTLRHYDHIMYSSGDWSHQNCRDTGKGGSDHTSVTCGLVLS